MRPKLGWVLAGAALVAVLAVAAMAATGVWQRVSSPGLMSAGHSDLACADCHVSWNTARAQMNHACLDCHRDEVGTARHTHSAAYLDIVGRRDTPWYLSPSRCLDCHRGHRRKTDARATTFLPDRYCVACHENVQQRVRPPDFMMNHEHFNFSSCASCHQFHERTLYKPRARTP